MIDPLTRKHVTHPKRRSPQPRVVPQEVFGAGAAADVSMQKLAAFARSRKTADRLSRSLHNLQGAGWTFQTWLYGAPELKSTDADGAYRFIQDPTRKRDRHEGDRLYCRCSDGQQYHLTRIDQVEALDFFHGTGDASVLENPDLAHKILDLEKRGLRLDNEWNDQTPGAWGAYLALQNQRFGVNVNLMVERVPFARVHGNTPQAVDEALASIHEELAVYDRVLRPAADRGELTRLMLGEVLQTVTVPVKDLSMEDRANVLLAVVGAVREGPEAKIDLADQTGNGKRAYEGLLELDLGGEKFLNAASTLVDFVKTVGTQDVKQPLLYLYRDIPRSSPYQEARQERELVLRRVMATGWSAKRAIEATNEIVMRPFDESVEDRLAVMEELVKTSRAQPGYLGRLEDLQAILRYRSPGQPLMDSARPYLTILSVLAQRGEVREAVPVYSFLQEGRRLGRMQGTMQELADGFAQAYALRGDLQEAQQHLVLKPPRLPSDVSIARDQKTVRIGKISIPVRER